MSVIGGTIEFLSVYEKDYVPKKVEGPLRVPDPDDDNCMIRTACVDNLTLHAQKLDSCSKEPKEHFCIGERTYYKDVIEKLKKEEPAVGKKYFEKPLDIEAIIYRNEYRPKSIYQVDYCKRGFSYGRSVVDKKDFGVKLDDDCVLPDTTMLYSYRDPKAIALRGIERTKSLRPIIDNTLKKKTVEILGTKCGNSTYEMSIGLLGQAVLEEKPYGTPQESPECSRWGEPFEGGYTHRIR